MGSSTVPAIGARLRQERRQRGISVRGLARKIGVSASLISQIETDKSSPSVSTLYAITTALGVSLEDLFGVADTRHRPTGDDGTGAEGEDGAAAPERGDGSPASGETVAGGVHTVAAAVAALAGANGGGVEADAASPGGHHPLEPSIDRRLGPVVTPAHREVLTLDSGVTWELLGRIPHAHVDFLLITYQPGGSSSGSGMLMRHGGIEYGYVISGELTLTLGFDRHRLHAGDAVSFESTTPHAYHNDGAEPAVGVWFVLEQPS